MESDGEPYCPCHAAVQCNLPDSKPGHSRRASRGTDQVLWIQRTVFHRGRFINVRELGCQTDPPISEEDRAVEHFPLNAAFGNAVPSAPSATSSDAFVSAPCSREHASVSRESRASKKTPRSSRPVTSTGMDPERQALEHQQMCDLTHGALDRACALQEHVVELNRLASAALICSRQFQSDFKPSHAFECGSRRSKKNFDGSSEEWSSRSSHLRQASRGSSRGRGCGKSNALPDLGGRPGSKPVKLQASTKMPWQELQGILSGCPDAALGSKVLLTGVEPWTPTIFSDLAPVGSSLHERLAASAAVYLPFERSRKERTTERE